jgi:hypothetical protein
LQQISTSKSFRIHLLFLIQDLPFSLEAHLKKQLSMIPQKNFSVSAVLHASFKQGSLKGIL